MSVAEEQRGVFSRAAALWLVLVGVLSFVGLLILTAYAPQMRGGLDGGPHELSRSAVGFAGLAKLLESQGRNVILARGPLRRGAVARVVIITPLMGDSASDVAEV